MAESTLKTGTSAVPVHGTAGLAKLLGVSRWTISRVLNGHAGVSEATRERVLAAVAELGFEPSKLARGLRGVPSRVIGVSFPHLEAVVLARKSQALQQELKAAGYRALFEMPEGDPDVEAAVVRHFLSIHVDGIVLIGSTLEPEAFVLEEVRARGVGIVAVDARNELPIARVSLDRGKAMELMLTHLTELGHRRIGILGFSSDDMYRPVREQGLRRAAGKLGLDIDRDLVRVDEAGHNLQSYQFGARLAGKVLELGTGGPTGLLCLNDRIAIGVMRGLQDAGRRVPEDYSVIGFDNLPEAAWTNPPLTTIDQSISKLMKQAHKALWSHDGPAKPPHHKVVPQLIARQSTGRAP